MNNNNFFLRPIKYTIVNVVAGGFAGKHLKLARDAVTWKGFLVHGLICAIEFLPAVGRTISLFEYFTAKLFQKTPAAQPILAKDRVTEEVPISAKIITSIKNMIIPPFVPPLAKGVYAALFDSGFQSKYYNINTDESLERIITIADVHDIIKESGVTREGNLNKALEKALDQLKDEKLIVGYEVDAQLKKIMYRVTMPASV